MKNVKICRPSCKRQPGERFILASYQEVHLSKNIKFIIKKRKICHPIDHKNTGRQITRLSKQQGDWIDINTMKDRKSVALPANNNRMTDLS